MSDVIPLSTVRTAADFAECLDQLRVLAGPLSHREIEGRSGGRLRRTKIGQVLAGELPRRDFLAAYLEVCGVPEDATAAWHQVWTTLATAARRSTRPIDETATLRKERDAAQFEARRLADEVRRLRSVIRTMGAEHNAAIQQAERTGKASESAENRLRTAEAVRDEAVGRARHLRDEIMQARTKIADLDGTVAQLRDERDSALDELASLRWQLDSRYATSGSKRLTRYTQDEAEDLYGSTKHGPPPVIGT
jgi:hypothetical protein